MTLAEVGVLIGEVSVAVSPAGLQEAIAVRDLLDARIAVAIGEFDALGLSDEDCSLSTTSWLRHRAGVDDKAAAKLTALGRRLHRFPALRQAALEGALTGGQLAVVSACVPERHFDRFADHEAAVVAELVGLGVAGTKVLMRSWLAKADAVDEPEPGPEPASELYHSQTLDGRGEVSASLSATTAPTSRPRSASPTAKTSRSPHRSGGPRRSTTSSGSSSTTTTTATASAATART